MTQTPITSLSDSTDMGLQKSSGSNIWPVQLNVIVAPLPPPYTTAPFTRLVLSFHHLPSVSESANGFLRRGRRSLVRIPINWPGQVVVLVNGV